MGGLPPREYGFILLSIYIYLPIYLSPDYICARTGVHGALTLFQNFLLMSAFSDIISTRDALFQNGDA